MGFVGTPFFLQVSGKLSDVILHGGVVGNGILLVLTVLSVVSWTIMIEKFRHFSRVRRADERFLEVFGPERSLKGLLASARQESASARARLVVSITGELEKGEIRSAPALDKLLESEITEITTTYETYMQFLATTASISPLLGLFGTVWGIMGSFLSMGAQGSASLFVVGPGIAVALITTIFGLGAAIPAVVGYNYLLRNIRSREDDLASFASRFRNRIVDRAYVELQRGAGEQSRGADIASPSLEMK